MSQTNNNKFGVSAALTTPFLADGQVDKSLLLRHVQRLLQQGCASVTLFGTTGEGPALGMREKAEVVDFLLQQGVAASKLVLGVLAVSHEEVLDMFALGQRIGCRRFLLAPPFYFKGVDEQGLLQWFSEVLSAVQSQQPEVILYHIPQLTAVPLLVSLIQQLQQAYPALVYGVKDSAGDWSNSKALLEHFPDLAIMIGDERLLEDAVRLGASGTISGIANFRADWLIDVVAGQPAHAGLTPLVNEVLCYPVIPAVKALVAATYDEAQWLGCRAPLLALSDDARMRLVDHCQSFLPAK